MEALKNSAESRTQLKAAGERRHRDVRSGYMILSFSDEESAILAVAGVFFPGRTQAVIVGLKV